MTEQDPSPPALPPPRAVDALVGTVVAGKYRLVSVIARGGVGCVYQGIQEPLGRTVAVKVLDIAQLSRPELREGHVKRFLREATVASRLAHPHTVVVHDFGEFEDGRLYLVMEFLDGPTLRAVLTRLGSLPVERALHIGRQIANSVALAHEHGVVHRDLKPPNVILVHRDGDPDFVKVVDFGLVKSVHSDEDDDLTQSGSFVGSPAYMSPEQAAGAEVDARSDIYAFGLLLYEMLTGRNPFRGPGEKVSTGRLLAAQLTAAPPPMVDVCPGLRIPRALDELVMKCLEKKRVQRPASMREVAASLDAILGDIRGYGPKSVDFSIGMSSPPASEPTDEDAAVFTSLPPRGRAPARRVIPWLIAGGVALGGGLAWWWGGVAPGGAPTAVDSHPSSSPGPAPAAAPASPAAGRSDAVAEAPVRAPNALAKGAEAPATAAAEAGPQTIAGVAPGEPTVESASDIPTGTAPGTSALVRPAPVAAAHPVVAPRAAPPALAPTVIVHFSSAPEGARVMDGDHFLGETPFDSPLLREGLAERRFVVEKAGFQSAALSGAVLGEEPLALHADLEPLEVPEIREAPPPNRPPPRAPGRLSRPKRESPVTPSTTRPPDIRLER